MKKILCFCLLLIIGFNAHSQKRPKVGLTLSGGGAKGFAHIGILQVIDSAGLPIDYITGTSMGSIMGSLYAIGYSGKEIEQATKGIDWGLMFANKPPLTNVNIDEKDEFDRYAAEIPLRDKKPEIFSGVFEGQELWLKLSELFLPVYFIKDFSKFDIPFLCVATDVENGNPIILDTGEITVALRSSMAIPSVFTPIEYQKTKLIDGGVSNNLPASYAKKNGAEIVIGVNVSAGTKDAAALTSAIDIIYQMGFYKDAMNHEKEVNLCDYFIEPDLTGYSAASFSSVEEIIEIGKKAALPYYPLFKALADSLNKIEAREFKLNRLPKNEGIIIEDVIITGNKHTSATYIKSKLSLLKGLKYNGKEIGTQIRSLFGSNLFTRINYFLEPTGEGKANLLIRVIEKPLQYIKTAIHYHSFSDLAVILNYSHRNLFFDRTNALLKINIGENFRTKAEYRFSFGKEDDNIIASKFYHESFRYPFYEEFDQKADYRSRFTNFGLEYQKNINHEAAIKLGYRIINFSLIPKVTPLVSYDLRNNHNGFYFQYQFNTLNRQVFPTTGFDITAGLEHYFNQNISLKTNLNDSISLDQRILARPYQQFQLKIMGYENADKITYIIGAQIGIMFNESNNYFNPFFVGGGIDFLRNQITFAGLGEYELRTNSIITSLFGMRYELSKNLFINGKINVGYYDFGLVPNLEPKFLSGYLCSMGYASGIGPLELSIYYSDQAKTLGGFVNFGFNF